MDRDVATVLFVAIAVPIAAIAFVWGLRREDDARRAAGRGLFSLGYQTRAGWIIGIVMVIAAWWLFTR